MSESQARSLVDEAEKKLTKFSFFTSKEEVREKSRDKFLQAATLFKTNENFADAARAYKRAADLSLQNKDELSYADDMLNAGAMLRKAKDPAYEDTLSVVVDLYDKNGKYSNASKVCQTLAEAGGPNSSEWFKRAVQYLRSEGSKHSANDLIAKMTAGLVDAGNYEAACREYENLGKMYLDEHLTRGNARKYFFMALLCRIACTSSSSLMESVELLSAQFQQYQELDTQFTDLTREHMLITGIIQALENEDEDGYTDAYMEYDSICPLDLTKKKLLLRGKQALRKATGAAEADDDDAR